MKTVDGQSCTSVVVSFSIQMRIDFGGQEPGPWQDYESGIMRESSAVASFEDVLGSEEFRRRHRIVGLRLVRITSTAVAVVVRAEACS